MPNEYFSTLSIKLSFVVHRGKPVSDFLDKVQVAVARRASGLDGKCAECTTNSPLYLPISMTAPPTVLL